jgi:hypothetical protein
MIKSTTQVRDRFGRLNGPTLRNTMATRLRGRNCHCSWWIHVTQLSYFRAWSKSLGDPYFGIDSYIDRDCRRRTLHRYQRYRHFHRNQRNLVGLGLQSIDLTPVQSTQKRPCRVYTASMTMKSSSFTQVCQSFGRCQHWY